ncbi:MAG: efflux RND transporter periplasmic adaptor subunit, partial [Acidimicrobiales bacterium]|nr:efflux RND transporter periplasmic adaptor subunit [Acidimicrobiales bacterium]
MTDHLDAHLTAAPMASGPTGPLQGLRILDVTEERNAQLEAGGTVSRTVTVESPQQGVVVHKAVFE